MTKFKDDSSHATNNNAELEGTIMRTEDVYASNEEPSFDPVLEKAWWKVDLAVVPVVSMFYLLAFLDRTNLANARVAGLQKDININNHQFSVALTVTYIPYILSQLPSNLVLKVESFQVSSFIFHSGIHAGSFSEGLLAFGIVRMDGIGGRSGWAWIFILEGLFTILFGLSTYITLPRSPAHARFLDKEEKDYVISHLRATDATAQDEDADSFSWREVWRTYTLLHVWMIGVVLFFSGVFVYGLAYFTPTIIADLGYTAVNAQLFSVPPFAVAFVVSMVAAYVSDCYGARGLVSIFAAILVTIGFAMYHGSRSLHVKYGSLFFSITGAYITLPTLSTWMANNTAPHTRRATAVAFASSMSNFGGILVTWLFGTLSPPPLYTKATVTLLIFSALTVVITAATVAFFSFQNKKKAAIRATTAREDERPGLGDRSAWFVYTL
ncbi:hypothetical protein C0995_003542 [Termitomyces sp. Mi166|nr:hypothetical protein C0995_003542 [Termitomyces sp. Mi166\